MKKRLTIFLLLTTSIAFAQSDSLKRWKKGGILAVNFSQASYTNWAAGGQNSFAGTAMFSFFDNYKKDKTTWENNLDLAYGMLKNGNDVLRKSEDKIEFNSKYSHYAFLNNWYYAALLNFKTQFDLGYNFPDDSTIVSHFMAPAFSIFALGLDYKTNDKSFSCFIAPLSGKVTIVNDQRLADLGAFGVDSARHDAAGVTIQKGELVRYEFGGYIKMSFKKDIMKNVNFQTKLELFSNYLDNPQNIDVNWETLLTMKVNKFLSTTLTTQLIYDHDIPVPVEREVNGVTTPGTGPRLQFKEVLAVGLIYKF
ncbi:MAG: DUF3078 domain-containing protein [Bacteroidota bacterium]|nr:DUF3078 domain-containing protein [Bacteroidota bacterium]